MRNIGRTLILVTLLALCSARAADLDASYSPTRAEWIKQAIVSSVYEQSNAWAKRLAVVVAVNAQENSVIVAITLANGEVEPSPEAKERYVQSVRSIVRSVLERYSWARDVKLAVQFV